MIFVFEIISKTIKFVYEVQSFTTVVACHNG